MPGLTPVLEAAGASDALDRRLDPDSRAPLAVAFSGGADSLFLLLAAKAWADRHGRRVLALTVDHRLQAASAGWTGQCAEVAARLGAGFRALAWDGAKPTTGLPAAARAARHRLLATAAREAGGRVILFGHTASDMAEGEVMRAEGANIGRLREWAPSPAWPQGREIFCLRPLLGLSRTNVRERLATAGWDWIDDPANDDMSFGRPRARALLKSAAPALSAIDSQPMRAPPDVGFGPDGSAILPRSAAADPRLLRVTLLCVGGGETPARTARVEALARRLDGAASVTATLGGCRILAGEREIVIVRDAGETKRGGLAPIDLTPSRPTVWDGRFELVAERPGLSVRALKGLAARLAKPERTRLSALPAAVRAALPAIMVDGEETVTCPILAEGSQVRAKALAAGRWLSACDLIAHERAADRLAHGGFTFDVLSWAQGNQKGRTE